MPSRPGAGPLSAGPPRVRPGTEPLARDVPARIARLRTAQGLSLLALASVAVLLLLWFAHQVSDANAARQRAESVRAELVDLRDALRLEHVALYRRLVSGQPGVTRALLVRMGLARLQVADLRARTDRESDAAAREAAARAQRELETLATAVESTIDLVPGSPAELAARAGNEATIVRLSAAADDWVRAEAARADLAADRQSELDERLSVGAVAAILAIGVLALLSWIPLERGRRRAVADLAGAAEDLAGQASTDPLTGLSNRRAFDQTLDAERVRAARSGAPLSVVLFDIDHFKRVNDDLGHQIGDRVLVEVARRLKGVVRAHELVARIGGEEFAWVLPGTAAGPAARAAERGRAVVAASPVEGAVVTLSAGVAELDGGGRLLERADSALYRAKREGRDRVVSDVPRARPEESGRVG